MICNRSTPKIRGSGVTDYLDAFLTASRHLFLTVNRGGGGKVLVLVVMCLMVASLSGYSFKQLFICGGAHTATRSGSVAWVAFRSGGIVCAFLA